MNALLARMLAGLEALGSKMTFFRHLGITLNLNHSRNTNNIIKSRSKMYTYMRSPSTV